MQLVWKVHISQWCLKSETLNFWKIFYIICCWWLIMYMELLLLVSLTCVLLLCWALWQKEENCTYFIDLHVAPLVLVCFADFHHSLCTNCTNKFKNWFKDKLKYCNQSPWILLLYTYFLTYSHVYICKKIKIPQADAVSYIFEYLKYILTTLRIPLVTIKLNNVETILQIIIKI